MNFNDFEQVFLVLMVTAAWLWLQRPDVHCKALIDEKELSGLL